MIEILLSIPQIFFGRQDPVQYRESIESAVFAMSANATARTQEQINKAYQEVCFEQTAVWPDCGCHFDHSAQAEDPPGRALVGHVFAEIKRKGGEV